MKYHFYLPGCVDIYCFDFVCPVLNDDRQDFYVFGYWDGNDGHREKQFGVHKDIMYKLKMEIVADEDN